MFYKTNMAESDNILARLHDVPGDGESDNEDRRAP
jgi:hypothetical protein